MYGPRLRLSTLVSMQEIDFEGIILVYVPHTGGLVDCETAPFNSSYVLV